MLERARCSGAGCDYCKHGTETKDFFGNKRYTCNAYSHKHKKIYADKCGEFRCAYKGWGIICSKCSSGE